jgi:ATP/maltotriose-dependent transcriptional regulator MalT
VEDLEGAISLAHSNGHHDVVTAARHQRGWAVLETDYDSAWPSLTAELEAERAGLTLRGDDRGLAESWLLTAFIDLVRGNAGPASDAADRALQFAAVTGDDRLEAQVRQWGMTARTIGPTPRSEAIRRTQDTLDWARARGVHHVLEAGAHCEMGWLEAIGGNFDRGRELVTAGREILEDLGIGYWLAHSYLWLAYVELLADSLEAAEGYGRHCLHLLQATEDRSAAGTAAGLLAEILFRQGSIDEAGRFTTRAQSLSDAADIDAASRWRATRARILTEHGERTEARRFALEAVAVLGSTDELNLRGEAFLALAEVEHATGNLAEAQDAGRAAVEAFDAKGNVVAAARAAELMGQAEPRG